MGLHIDEILDVLRQRGIEPDEPAVKLDHTDIGEIGDGETIYSTSIKEVFGDSDGEGSDYSPLPDDDRLSEWRREIERIIAGGQAGELTGRRSMPRREPPEPGCAWYCPIHFFGHSWGIYIRESCILSCAIDIARYVKWSAVTADLPAIAHQLLRSAFYVFFYTNNFTIKSRASAFASSSRAGAIITGLTRPKSIGLRT
jgi:hypothetical protein